MTSRSPFRSAEKRIPCSRALTFLFGYPNAKTCAKWVLQMKPQRRALSDFDLANA